MWNLAISRFGFSVTTQPQRLRSPYFQTNEIFAPEQTVYFHNCRLSFSYKVLKWDVFIPSQSNYINVIAIAWELQSLLGKKLAIGTVYDMALLEGHWAKPSELRF